MSVSSHVQLPIHPSCTKGAHLSSFSYTQALFDCLPHRHQCSHSVTNPSALEVDKWHAQEGIANGLSKSPNGLPHLSQRLHSFPIALKTNTCYCHVQEALNIEVSERTISNSLKSRGFTRKKVCFFIIGSFLRLRSLEVSRESAEWDEARQNLYQAALAQFPPETLVFLDESACNRHTLNRTYAWGPIGDHAR